MNTSDEPISGEPALLSRMIGDLLDIVRLADGRMELRPVIVALEGIVNSAANKARPGIEARNVELEITLPASPILLNVDIGRVEMILAGLLTNAGKSSDAGGKVSLSAALIAESTQGAPEVAISVRDNGSGLPPEMLPGVFDLFGEPVVDGDPALLESRIGLSLARRIVNIHGGGLEVRSEGPGCGSDYVVRLPIVVIPFVPTGGVEPSSPVFPPALREPLPKEPERVEPEKLETPQSAPASEESSKVVRSAAAIAWGNSRRILVVDDNEDSARTMSLLLRRRGNETRCAFSGAETLTAAVEFLPEVVLLDIGLPGMDGYEVARRLRAMEEISGVFLVAVSGYGRPEDRERAKEAGFDEYMVKPANLELLQGWLQARDSEPQGTAT